MLLVAGHETTTNFIGNGVLALLRHPDQLHLLKEQPDLIESAAEEFLRYDGAAPGMTRVALEEVELEYGVIPKGQVAFGIAHAANRDPDVFNDPDRFDITRSNANKNLAFGHGPHVCIGAPLARLETKIAVSTLIQRFPDMTLVSNDLEWIHGLAVRGAVSIPVSI